MMLSRSPSPPPQLSTACAPHHNWDRAGMPHEEEAVPLADSDRETNRLLPRRRRRHRVRIQGRLAIVRTVSVANPRQTKSGSPNAQTDVHCEDVRTSHIGLRSSYDGSETGDEDGDDFAAERDARLRGYGIGGAGNIRRPMDIIGAPSSASPSLLSLIHIPSSPPATSLSTTKPDKWRWRMAGFLHGLRCSKRKGEALMGD
ncbi:hypothetical protein F5Y10DRAFT_236265 [Nemania abortiva]|nr:hypothetical protein F5Y10DRAFT_236265 [Nemania abortiva]